MSKIDRVIELLEEISAKLDPVTEIEFDGCLHPQELIVDLSTLADPNHRVCSVCRERVS